MRELLIGSNALRDGVLTRYQLERQHRRVFPDVYAPKSRQLSLADRAAAAWLWSRGRAVISGAAAASLHGARWIGDDVPIEVVCASSRPPRGLIARNEILADDEVTRIGELTVTTLSRTAFDLGRHLPRGQAIARLDALMRASPFRTEEVSALADRYRGARGVRQLRKLLPLVDGGAASPKETWLRMLIIDAGLPAPRTQIPVQEARGLIAVLDMGWEEFKVAAEYDGDHHRSDRRQYVWDQRRSRLVAERGWEVVRVIKEDRDEEVIERVRNALWRRGWRP